MGRALPPLDVSLTWPLCETCGQRHRTQVACPPLGAWLVQTLCSQCTSRWYCSAHDVRSERTKQSTPARMIDGSSAGGRS